MPFSPSWFRFAVAHPERVEALIVQDAVAHNTGLGANWKTRARLLGRSRGERKRAPHKSAIAADNAEHAMWGTIRNVERYDPDSGPMNLPF